MQLATICLFASACVIGLMGLAHLFYTFHGNKFDPRDAALTLALQRVSPVISRQTTMARAAKGFHASHSLGALLFSLVYGYLAWYQGGLLQQSGFLRLLGLAVLLAYLALAQRYWFRVPLLGIGAATALYAGGLVGGSVGGLL